MNLPPPLTVRILGIEVTFEQGCCFVSSPPFEATIAHSDARGGSRFVGSIKFLDNYLRPEQDGKADDAQEVADLLTRAADDFLGDLAFHLMRVVSARQNPLANNPLLYFTARKMP
jgi:hypothetical protein